MARINPALLDKLSKKLKVSKKRLYALIQKSSAANRVPRHLGALLLAGENGLSIDKYATRDELNDLRGVKHPIPVLSSAPADPPARNPARRARRSMPQTKENTVFVVHGRDAKLRDSMYDFLRALGLKPQEWGHAIRAAARGRGGNPYVSDAVTRIMEQAQAIVVLLSPDDEVRLKEQFLTKQERTTEGRFRGQARPNVIFETGIAIGTHHKKTVIVRVGEVKPFTDIGGMHIAPLTNEDAARHDLANRLEILGCRIDRSGDHWLRAGDFEPTAPTETKRKRPR